jgi:hypothetical protein
MIYPVNRKVSDMTTTAAPSTTTLRLRPAVGGLLGAGLALALNLSILFVADLVLDGSVQVAQPGGAPQDLAVVAVIAASVLPLALGALGLALLARLLGDPRALRVWSITVGVVAVLSIGGPASLSVNAGSIAALAAMHLATGVAAVLGQATAARR